MLVAFTIKKIIMIALFLVFIKQNIHHRGIYNMLFNSSEFLIFFPIVVFLYFVLPSKIKNIWLLIASYYFYMCWNAQYVLLILTSTVITYISGILIEKVASHKAKKAIVTCSLLLNLGTLGYYKYSNLALSILTYIFNKFGIGISIPTIDVLLPVGISFYTFQVLGYTIDVYRQDIYAEKNFFRYALFVSFFPQLVAGPIERSKNLLKQLATIKKFNLENARDGIFLMLWGFFLKIVLADRIAIFVDTVYANYQEYTGYYIMIATALFAVQIYCDFAGYSIIAMGAAEILGIKLMENFEAPYFATSVSDFWRRWHISLTSWFKDYLYIPLGGSKAGKFRKYVNKMIVFMVSGLWHGASISFVIWGCLNGLYQIIGELLKPIRNSLVLKSGLNRNSYGHKLLQCAITFILIDFSWIFFRASSTQEAIQLIRHLVSVKNPWILFDGSLYQCGLNIQNYGIIILGIMILIFADFMKCKGIVIRKVIIAQDYWFRCLVIIISVLVLIIYGIWGATYDATSFIYFQF